MQEGPSCHAYMRISGCLHQAACFWHVHKFSTSSLLLTDCLQGTARADDVEAMIEKARSEGKFKEPTHDMYNPLIIMDKRTGKKSMVMSPWTVYCFEGMSPRDSRQLAKDLAERCCRPERVYRYANMPSAPSGCTCCEDCCNTNRAGAC